MILVKKHIANNHLILALCDKELFGKIYKENSLCLDLSCNFYNGKLMHNEDIKKLIKQAYIVNLAGEKSLKIVKELNLIDDKNIIYIKKIPHVQILITMND
jgi:uncharacterized protein